MPVCTLPSMMRAAEPKSANLTCPFLKIIQGWKFYRLICNLGLLLLLEPKLWQVTTPNTILFLFLGLRIIPRKRIFILKSCLDR